MKLRFITLSDSLKNAKYIQLKPCWMEPRIYPLGRAFSSNVKITILCTKAVKHTNWQMS